MKGRKPKPTALKALQGTQRKGRANPGEPDYMLLQEIPAPPPYLSEEGRRIYYSTAEDLLQTGLLTKVGLPVFLMYVIEISKYFEAAQQLEKLGYVYKDTGGGPKVNPYQRIATEALAAAVKIAVEFGITPSSASRVNLISKAIQQTANEKLLQNMFEKQT